MNRSAWSEARVRGTSATPPLRRALALLALLAIWLIAAPAHALPSYLAANLAYVRETRHLDASGAAQASGDLDSLHADATWTYKQTWVFGAGLFNTTGSSDANLYAPNPVDGSNAGKPDSNGYLVQLEYVPFGKLDSPERPWLNMRVGVQYTGYSKLNGASSNYDGFGRNASDNDTVFGFLWVAL